MIIMPGYCVAGTVGHKILNGQKKIEFKKGKVLDIKMSVQYMSFSAHADAKVNFGILVWRECRDVGLLSFRVFIAIATCKLFMKDNDLDLRA